MKKANLKGIMKRAWEIKREHKDNIFYLCLKMAWAEAKKVLKGTEKQVKYAKDLYNDRISYITMRYEKAVRKGFSEAAKYGFVLEYVRTYFANAKYAHNVIRMCQEIGGEDLCDLYELFQKNFGYDGNWSWK